MVQMCQNQGSVMDEVLKNIGNYVPESTLNVPHD